MKSIVILYADSNSLYMNEKAFDNKSAFDLCKEWAKKAGDETVIIDTGCNNISELLEKMSAAAEEKKADYVIFSFADLPFLNASLTEELKSNHIEFKAEYSFADGYPYGFTPELIETGSLKIMTQLSKTSFKDAGEKPVSRTGIFDFMKTDINAFEIETVLAEEDWRLFRFNFDCSKKENFIACKELYKKGIEGKSAAELSKIASETAEILKTVPGFYNIQITDTCKENCIYCPYCSEFKNKTGKDSSQVNTCINPDKMKSLINDISNFSENAVISLSAWGDCGENPMLLDYINEICAKKGLSVFLEINGKYLTDDFCNKIAKIKEASNEPCKGYEKLMIAVPLDAMTQKTYSYIHNTEDSITTAVENVKKLAAIVPGCVYPQFVRMTDNEEELESFYRFWNDKNNGSQGNFIIEKYSDFTGLLKDRMVADLSPLERNICWHLRRDMTILTNGDVPLCREMVLDGILGNVFDEGIEAVWNKLNKTLNEHINKSYNEKCRKCHEYYTFQF